MDKGGHEYVLRILAVAVLVIAALLWVVAGHFDSERVSQLVGGIAADVGLVSVIYLVISLVLDSRELSPEAASRRELIREIARRVRRAPEIEAVYARITDTPYGEYFSEADRVEMVGRWFNETISRHPSEIEDFFRRGGQLEVVLIDPSVSETFAIAADQYAGASGATAHALEQADTKVRSTVDELAAACRNADVAFSTAVSIRFFSGHLNYWGLRFQSRTRDILASAAFDTFRIQASAYPSVVYDLHQSPSTVRFWVAEMDHFQRRSRSLQDWTASEIEASMGSTAALRAYVPVMELEQCLHSAGMVKTAAHTWEWDSGVCEIKDLDGVSSQVHLMPTDH